MTTRCPSVSVQINPGERALLEVAAQRTRMTLSDFIRRKAIEAAEMEVLDRRVVTIPAADWEKFEAWAQAPAKTVPALRAFVGTRPAWQD